MERKMFALSRGDLKFSNPTKEEEKLSKGLALWQASPFMSQKFALANETSTASTGISTLQPTVWTEGVILAALPQMKFRMGAVENFEAVGKSLLKIEMPFESSVGAGTSSKSEAAPRSWTEITELTAKEFDFSTGYKYYGITISREVFETSPLDYIAVSRRRLAYYAADAVETALVDALKGATPLGEVFGGDATSTATLANGDILTPQMIAYGHALLKGANYGENGVICFVTPTQAYHLKLSSKLYSAAERGSALANVEGYIGRIDGVDIVESNYVPGYTTWGSGTVHGHRAIMVDPTRAIGLAWKIPAETDSYYDKNKRSIELYLDMCFKAALLNSNAIVHINSTDV